MFRPEFTETITGTVQVDDISSKTMKVLLKYWYTGKLQPSWRDSDVIVEFTYAAGKYQMTQVLQMLDEVLGYDNNTHKTDIDMLKLLDKLSLKNAESRMLKRLIHKIRLFDFLTLLDPVLDLR